MSMQQTREPKKSIPQQTIAFGDEANMSRLPIKKIKLNRNSRLDIKPEDLSGLMQSIKEEGLLQPIGVVKLKRGDGYEICYGNRRFLACSRLGMTSIPVIVHAKQKDADIDIMNLTENIQRRNVSLSEIGRYVEILRKDGLQTGEIAIRLGVSKSYVTSCLEAYNSVPTEYRDDLEIRVTTAKKGSTRTRPGKISVRTARDIVNMQKTYGLNPDQVKKLFKAAKSDEKFSPNRVTEYAALLLQGEEKFVEKASDETVFQLQMYISHAHKDELRERYIENGPFQTLGQLFVAILRGEKNVPVDVKFGRTRGAGKKK